MAGSVLTCPSCDSPLRLSSRVEAGQKIRCPHCKEVFSPNPGIRGKPPRRKEEYSDPDHRPRRQRAEEDRPRRRRRSRDEKAPDLTGRYVLIGSLGLVGVAGALMLWL